MLIQPRGGRKIEKRSDHDASLAAGAYTRLCMAETRQANTACCTLKKRFGRSGASQNRHMHENCRSQFVIVGR